MSKQDFSNINDNITDLTSDIAVLQNYMKSSNDIYLTDAAKLLDVEQKWLRNLKAQKKSMRLTIGSVGLLWILWFAITEIMCRTMPDAPFTEVRKLYSLLIAGATTPVIAVAIWQLGLLRQKKNLLKQYSPNELIKFRANVLEKINGKGK